MSRTSREHFDLQQFERILAKIYHKNHNLLDPRSLSNDASYYLFLRKKVSQKNKRISIRQLSQADFQRYADKVRDEVRDEVIFSKEDENQQHRTEFHIGYQQQFLDQFNNPILPRRSYLGANHYDLNEENILDRNNNFNDGRVRVSEVSLDMDENSSQESGMNPNPEASNTAVEEKQLLKMCRENYTVREQTRGEYKDLNQIKLQFKSQSITYNTLFLKNQIHIQVSLLGQPEQSLSREEKVQAEEEEEGQSVPQIQPLADQEAQYEALIVPDIELQVESVVDQLSSQNVGDHPLSQLMIGQTINQVLIVAQPEEMIQPPIPQQVIQEIPRVQQNINLPQYRPFNHDNLEPRESQRIVTIKRNINNQLINYQDEYIRAQKYNFNPLNSQSRITSSLTQNQRIPNTNINHRQRLENETFRVGKMKCNMYIDAGKHLRVQSFVFVFTEQGSKIDEPKQVTSRQPLVKSTDLNDVTGIKKAQRFSLYLALLKQFKIVE